jgi:ribosomal protein L37E
MAYQKSPEKALKLWHEFQTPKAGMWCKRCGAKITSIQLCDWKLGWKDCARIVCSHCGFKASGKLYCPEHERIWGDTQEASSLIN